MLLDLSKEPEKEDNKNIFKIDTYCELLTLYNIPMQSHIKFILWMFFRMNAIFERSS